MGKEETFGEMLLASLGEAVAYDRGETAGTEVRRVAWTVREAQVEPPESFAADRVVSLRQRMGVSQAVFASMLNVSRASVRAWEQGVRTPEGPALRLLELAERAPEVLASLVSVASSRATDTPSVRYRKPGRPAARVRETKSIDPEPEPDPQP